VPLPADLRYILESAILAPSADNQHRIRFELTEDTVSIRHIGPALLPQLGYKRVLSLLSLGAVAENLAIAASRSGRRADVRPFPDPARPDLAMSIHLRPDEVVPDPLWSAIPERHTCRQVLFQGPPLSGAEKENLDAEARVFPGCSLTWLDGHKLRGSALRIMRQAESERFRNPLLHEELFSAIRFDVGWRSSCAIGLPPGALGVEPPLRPFFALLRHWPIMHAANLLGCHRLLGWRSCDLPCRLAPNLGLLAAKSIDAQTIFATGRAFQRVWLQATQLGRVLQPMPASALYALDGAHEEGIPTELQRALEEGWRKLSPGQIPLMVFRMGKAKPHAIHTGRQSLDDLVGHADQ
jgi:hypothetical protein